VREFLKLLPWIFREIWHIFETLPWNYAFFPRELGWFLSIGPAVFFRTAHPCDQHTDGQTALRATSVATGRICACSVASDLLVNLLLWDWNRCLICQTRQVFSASALSGRAIKPATVAFMSDRLWRGLFFCTLLIYFFTELSVKQKANIKCPKKVLGSLNVSRAFHLCFVWVYYEEDIISNLE